MPGPHLVSSLLKRWTARTVHYRVSRQQLPYYLDEFTFRFNRRTSRARGLLFYRLLQQSADTDPHPSASSSAAPATTGMNLQTTKRQLHSSRYTGCMFDSYRGRNTWLWLGAPVLVIREQAGDDLAWRCTLEWVLRTVSAWTQATRLPRHRITGLGRQAHHVRRSRRSPKRCDGLTGYWRLSTTC
jgi:hypothetical protein